MQIPRPLATLPLALFMILACSCAKNSQSFHFVDGDGYRELQHGSQPIYRYMIKYDPKDHLNTYKPYQHAYGFHNEGFITKGPGGAETHHRGIFFGLGTQYGNFWACTDGAYQKHEKFLADRELITADTARVASVTSWIDKSGKTVARDTREVTARWIGDDQYILDYDITFEPLAGDIEQKNNAHHAGFHFRAAEEVGITPTTTKTSVHTGQATYIRPPGATLIKDDEWKNTQWAAATFSIKGHPYVVIHMNHPSNPDTTYSTRPYGRFGAFITQKTLKQSEPLHLRYRIIVRDGQKYPAKDAELASLYADFTR